MSIAFPFPSSTEERPLELLYACHDKVRHFSALIGKLAPHVAAQGADQEAQEAAANALRYFEQALPLHHADEEEDVFPALRSLRDSELNAAIEAAHNEHLVLDRLWQSLRDWLKQIASGQTPAQPPYLLPQFVRDYPAHATHEENEVFVGLERLPEDEVKRIGRRMRERRGATA
jgi:hemerythrin superfamily protein